MNKKLLLISSICLSFAFCFVAFVAGCGSNAQTASSSGSPSNNNLVVGFDAAYPPYGYVDNTGNYTGVDLDLAQEVAKRNGWQYTAKPIDWDAKDAELKSGQISCIWNGFTIEGREGDYCFSDPYMINKQVIVVKKDSNINSSDELSGKNVATQVDSAALNVLKKNKQEGGFAKSFKTIQELSDYNSAFMQLESGAIDAVACDSSIADYQMAAKSGIFNVITVLSEEHYGVGVKQGENEFISKINKTLKEMNQDGTVKKICDKYKDQGISYENWILK